MYSIILELSKFEIFSRPFEEKKKFLKFSSFESSILLIEFFDERYYLNNSYVSLTLTIEFWKILSKKVW